MVYKRAIPQDMIESAVNELPVDMPDADVRTLIEARARKVHYTPAKVTACGDYAIQVHRKNQELYMAVQTGQIGDPRG